MPPVAAAPPGDGKERSGAARPAATSAQPVGQTAGTSLPAKASTLAGQGASLDELRRVRSSPVVRKIAQEHAIDISRLQGTGISGRVTKRDILDLIEKEGRPACARQA